VILDPEAVDHQLLQHRIHLILIPPDHPRIDVWRQLHQDRVPAILRPLVQCPSPCTLVTIAPAFGLLFAFLIQSLKRF
jgi:hypothetical protein